jgi:hypothetical protein
MRGDWNGMNAMMKATAAIAALLLAAGCASDAKHEEELTKQMSFFVASSGSTKGADLAGADRQCQALAAAAGAGARTWRAYLRDGAGRERIGRGPWYNANGVVIAKNVEDLQADPNINKQTALTEKGAPVEDRGDRLYCFAAS